MIIFLSALQSDTAHLLRGGRLRTPVARRGKSSGRSPSRTFPPRSSLPPSWVLSARSSILRRRLCSAACRSQRADAGRGRTPDVLLAVPVQQGFTYLKMAAPAPWRLCCLWWSWWYCRAARHGKARNHDVEWRGGHRCTKTNPDPAEVGKIRQADPALCRADLWPYLLLHAVFSGWSPPP